MNLSEQLNQLADDAGLRSMPAPSEVRRTGARLRLRRRLRTAAALALVISIALTLSSLVHLGQKKTMEPVHPSLSITRSMAIPGWGELVYADNALWVVDAKDGELTADGTAPAGEIFQLDPASMRVLARIPHAVGGWSAVGQDTLWMCTLAGDLNVLTKVGLSTHEVTRIETRPGHPFLNGVALAQGNVWVALSLDGDLVTIDPARGGVTKRVHIGSDDTGQSPHLPLTLDGRVWAATDVGQIVGLDGGTGATVAKLQLPFGHVLLRAAQGHTLYASSGNRIFEVNITPDGRPTLGRQIRIGQEVDQGEVWDMTVGDGALWVAYANPDQLLRVDLQTFQISGRLPLPGIDHAAALPVALTAAARSVWVRIDGKLLEVR